MSTTYGGHYGGDPRKFFPDEEACTAEELAAHKAACDAWNRGDQVEVRTRSCSLTLGCERPFGVGVTVHDDDANDPLVGDEEEDKELDEQEDDELLGIYLSNAGADSERAARILADRHGIDEAQEVDQ
jgi:hypothetical protein